MIWILIKEGTGETFPVFPNILYRIGRLGTDLVLKDDKSISLTHAFLTVSEESHSGWLELEDAGSKNGTFVNEDIRSRRPIKKNLRVRLYQGDLVQFGVMGNAWLVRHMNFYSTSSGLKCTEIENLSRTLVECGGKHVPVFNKHCTHLTMSEMKVTLKVVKALLSDIPIVSTDYWQDLLSVGRKEKNGPVCSVDKYMPRITDMLLVHQNFYTRSHKERKTVFVGKIFVFMSQKHFEIYAPIVEDAGGSSRGLKNGVQKAFLLRRNVVVIQYIPSVDSQNSQGSQAINTIAEYLQANSRRFIPEYEIALAIVQCSTDKYCNPDYKTVSNMISFTSTLQDSESMCVENTSVANARTSGESDFIILETESSQQCSSQKQLLEELQLDTSPDGSNNKQSNSSMSLLLKKKRTRHNMVASGSESETEYENCVKKAHMEYDYCRDIHSFVVSNACEKEVVTDMNEEDDLFNFDHGAQLSPNTKPYRGISPLNQFDANSYGILKIKTVRSTDVVVYKESDLVDTQSFNPNEQDSVLTQPFNAKKVLSKKFSTKGWKTFSDTNKSKTHLKSIFIKSEDDDERFGCRSEPFKGGFRINMFSNECEFRSLITYVNKTSASINSSNVNPRGFKNFVKQILWRGQP